MAELFKESAGGNGIFIQTCRIKELKKNEPGLYPKAINYVLILAMNKKDSEETFDKYFYLAGNLLNGAQIPPNITSLLYTLGINEEANADQLVNDLSVSKLTPELKKFFEGKEIKMLSFVSGVYTGNDGTEKPSYKFWDGRQGFKNVVNVFDLQTPDEDIVEAFKKQLLSNYKPAYTPEVLENKPSGNPDLVDEVDSI